MTVTYHLKIIDNKMKANQAQYDVDRLADIICAKSSGELGKYEYLTGGDLGYKPSVIEQANFDYSPLGKAFNKGLDKDHQKEGLFKKASNFEDKNEELLKETKNQGIKQSDSKKTKNKSDLIYDSNHSFYKYRLKKFSEISSIECKFDMLEVFYKEFTSLKFVDAKLEKRDHEFIVFNNASNLYNNKLTPEYQKAYEMEPKNNKSVGWKQKYSPKNLKTLDYQPAELKTESLSDENRSDIKQPV